jgi:hypothetical protein
MNPTRDTCVHGELSVSRQLEDHADIVRPTSESPNLKCSKSLDKHVCRWDIMLKDACDMLLIEHRSQDLECWPPPTRIVISLGWFTPYVKADKQDAQTG